MLHEFQDILLTDNEKITEFTLWYTYLTCLTLFLELDTLKMPRMWRPLFSICLRQEETMCGILGSFSVLLEVTSTIDPVEMVSRSPTLPPKLSEDPALWNKDQHVWVCGAFLLVIKDDGCFRLIPCYWRSWRRRHRNRTSKCVVWCRRLRDHPVLQDATKSTRE